MASDNIPEWMNVKIINGLYSGARGGWQELFEYGGIRYNSFLRPNVDGGEFRTRCCGRLQKASEEGDDDRIDDYADDCRRLIWPLIKHDYASRTQLEKPDLSPTKKVVPIEGRTVDGELQAFCHTRKLGYPHKTHPKHVLELSYLSQYACTLFGTT